MPAAHPYHFTKQERAAGSSGRAARSPGWPDGSSSMSALEEGAPGGQADMVDDMRPLQAEELKDMEEGLVEAEDGASYRPSFEMKRYLGTSIIKEVGVEERFRQTAAMMEGSTRFFSSTTVVLHNVTHKYSVGEESKAFPTVGEVLADPFVRLGKRLRRTLTGHAAAAGRSQRDVYALRDVSAVLEPAKLYLVIGGPKCGKTSFLRAVAGRPPSGRVQVSGSVLYNGERAKDAEFNIKFLACYVEETDNNEALLTVRETLEFAGSCIQPLPSKQLRQSTWYRHLVERLELDAPGKRALLEGGGLGSLKVRRAMAKERAEVVMALLGLANCSETIIGNHTHRGVSGGERRRVTLAEMMMGRFSLTCFDEISNGLDSAATFDIVSMIRAGVHHLGSTCVIALNQPSPEVYALFDEVIVLKSGQLVYQGSPAAAQAHFESLGFRCPPSMDLADFLVAVTGKGSAHRKLLADRSEPGETGGGTHDTLTSCSVPSVASDFALRYRKSAQGRARLSAVEAEAAAAMGAKDGRRPVEWGEHETLAFVNGWATSLRVCLEREVVLTLRDRSYIGARLGQDVLLGLLTGLIFFDLSEDAISTRFGALYQMLLTIAFQTAACVPAYFAHRSVFYKQRAAGFFCCSAYLVASTLAAAPLVLLDSAIFGGIAYWCMGLARDGHGLSFIIFLGHLTMLGWAMMCFFKLSTFLCPDLTTSAALCGIVTFFLLLFSGFVMAIRDVPPYYLPVLYLNPVFWCFQALASNEFLSEKHSVLLPGTDKSLGQTILRQKGLHEDKAWVWYGLLANAGITCMYLLATWLAMRHIEHHEPISADASPEEAMSSLFSAASFRQPGSARRTNDASGAGGEPDSSGSSDKTRAAAAARGAAAAAGGAGSGNLSLPPPIMEDEELKADAGDSWVDSYLSGAEEDGEGKEEERERGDAEPTLCPAVTFETAAPSVMASISSLTQQLSESDLEEGESAHVPRLVAHQASSFWQLQAVSAIPFVPCALSFADVWYSVPNAKNGGKGKGKTNGNGNGGGGGTLDLLKGVSGLVTPGTMMALMGSSGAGKTTLLDVLAGRKTSGKIKGDILVNGVRLEPSVFKTLVGYVEQFGCISPYMTVAEVLRFNAELRLPSSVDPSTRHQFVRDVLRLLELDPISHSVVGRPGGGLSFEELKRVTIGAEVVANPSLLFLDEPTTGLDARAAMIVVRVLRKLAQTGRAIICTIHQPSKEIFACFDALLLLKKGGLTVYCGPLGEQAQTLVRYFQAVPGTPHISEGENPASWMLDCLGAGTGLGEEKADYVAAWQASPQSASALAELQATVAQAQREQGPTMASLRSRTRASFPLQLRACFLRAARSSWRMPEYQLARIGGTAALGLALGSLYWDLSQETVAGLVSFIALIFLATTFVSSINATAVLQVVALEKPSFARERFNQMYNVCAYVCAAFLVEVPWVLLQALCYMATFYPTCGYSPTPWRVAWFAAFSFLYMLFSTAFGQAIGAFSPSVQVAQIALNCILPIFSMMSGMTIIPIDLPRAWRPLWVITPFNKAFEGLVMTQWGRDATGQIAFFDPREKQYRVLSKEEFVDSFFGTFSFEDRWRDFGVLFAFVFVCNLAFYLSLKYRKLEDR